jgi:hypothetical protein
MEDMLLKLVIVCLLLGGAYYVHTYVFISENFENKLKYAPAPIEYSPPLRRPIEVSSSGPSAPSKAPPVQMPPTAPSEPAPRDPMDDMSVNANAQPEMRYPERSFGPGKIPTDTAIARAAGIASQASKLTSQSAQHFNPELVTNGGMFYGDVSPNEDENPNYTAF